MNTNELSGAALDWAVAKCEKPEWLGNQAEVYVLKAGFHPSINWAQGGVIIEREKISINFDGDSPWIAECGWCRRTGETPLIAAMRSYVALKLGDEIEIPEGV